MIDICIGPLLIYLKIHGIEKTIAQLLENPTDNDWKALFKLDARLNNLQLHLLRKDFLKELKLDISSDFNDFELAGIVSNVSW